MSSVIDQIKRHFDGQGIKSIDVYEWADEQGKPLTIYYEAMTVKAKDRLKKYNDKYGNTLEWLVHVLIIHALNAQGEPLFTLEDKQTLMQRADASVIERVASAIMLDDNATEDLKKN
jgi:hypothetical protein